MPGRDPDQQLLVADSDQHGALLGPQTHFGEHIERRGGPPADPARAPDDPGEREDRDEHEAQRKCHLGEVGDGAGQTPPNQVLIGLALFLTLFVMSPVVDRINEDAVKPYVAGTIDSVTALSKAVVPLKGFMLNQTRESDIATFVRIAGGKGYATPQDVPLTILVPAFVTSELKTAFTIGFLIFIPFVIIDLVVASVLMSMGMMMLSPILISLPFKLMLFVLVDGWSLVMGTLASSFYS